MLLKLLYFKIFTGQNETLYAFWHSFEAEHCIARCWGSSTLACVHYVTNYPLAISLFIQYSEEDSAGMIYWGKFTVIVIL